MRRSLVVRLLAASVLISVCSIAATAWLAVRTTARAIRQEQGQAFADDTRVYDALLARASTHPDWSGVQEVVDRLARETGHRITLTGQDRRPIADSATHPGPLPARASVTVDPLAVDPAFAPGTSDTDRIDRRAVGPFRLPASERAALLRLATDRAECLRDSLGIEATVTTTPSGRPDVTAPPAILPAATSCASPALTGPTPTESRAVGQLESLLNDCLLRRGTEPVVLAPDLTWKMTGARTTKALYLVPQCLGNARREQLGPYVAAPALLFISSPPRADSVFDLSAPNRLRITGVMASVLLLTVVATVALGRRLVRPLWKLTAAARRIRDGDTTVRAQVTGADEIAQLAEAFNDMSAHRAHLDGLRRSMVGDVAHELRTPLSNIRAWLEAAEDGLVPADKALISSLLEEALLLQHVVEDLRDLAAADAGELHLSKTRTDIGELLAQTVTSHAPQAEAAGVTLATATARNVRPIDADSLRLRQALSNLLGNAIRHTPTGGEITLEATRAQDVTRIRVTDTGSGISPTDLPRVFDRFWRAERSRNRQGGGSGLGLPITRHIIELHDGTITAESTLGKGTTFTLTIPDEAPRP
ncbi:sensor histidine kinase [Streptomyces canus]|uniref:sensor histidine kinase n=1 Tax=Streptomyces canus TaxID=58343 RepID=UPI00380F7159